MPAWLDRFKEAARAVLPGAAAPNAAAAPAVEDSAAPEPPAAPETPNFLATVAKLAPAVLLGIGGTLTLFAAQIGNWAALGFMLLAAAPIVYQLQRLERRLQELVELQKRRKK